jgi:hypothetical protein
MKSKRAQDTIGLSFNWIFAIILIIIFIFSAIYGIKYFMDISHCSTVGFAYDDLQKYVDNAYQSSSTTKDSSLNLPGIKKICFANLSKPITGDLDVYKEINVYEFEEANVFLFPPKSACEIPFKFIKHINLDKIIEKENPYCIDIEDGEAIISIKKDYYDKAVTLQ